MYNKEGNWVDPRFSDKWKELAIKTMNPEQIVHIAFIHGRKNIETEHRLGKLIEELQLEKSKLESIKYRQVRVYTNDFSNSLQKITNILTEIKDLKLE